MKRLLVLAGDAIFNLRKVSLILAVVLFTVPAWAAVTINCAQVGTSNDIIISYVNGEAKKIRAFALDITVTNGTITAVSDTITPWYTIHPGSIVIVDGNVTNWGSAVADPCDLPSDTKKGIGTNGITIEMGALYPNDPCGPPNSGNLLRFTVTPAGSGGSGGCGGSDSIITITKNQGRGGVVLTDPNWNGTVTAPGCTIVRGICGDCLIGGNAGTKEYTDWVAWGKPNCWCYCKQCRGDADGKKTLANWVAVPDLNALLAAYGKNDAALALVPNGICADFDHKKTLANRVAVPDLNILLTYYGKGTPPRCDQAPIITGPYNFWCGPAGCPITCP